MSHIQDYNNASPNGRHSLRKSDYHDPTLDDDKQNYAVNSETPGYISIKDYAYDQSNPLHHGFSEGSGTPSDDYELDVHDINGAKSDVDDSHDKRQSIILPEDYVINHLAIALYDFEPENDNELGLKEGDIVFISYRHGQGWLVAENHERTKTGLVPEEFVTHLSDDDDLASGYHDDLEEGETARPFYLTHFITQGMNIQSDETASSYPEKAYSTDAPLDNDGWEDIDELNDQLTGKLNISHD